MQNHRILSPTHSNKISWFLALLVVSFVFQLAGCVSPGWMYLVDDSGLIHVGLWYSVMCVNDACDTIGHNELLTSNTIWTNVFHNTMREFQIETCIALASCISGIVIFLQAKRSFNGLNNRSLLIPAFISCALSGILALVASGKFADGIIKAHNLLNDFNIPSPFRFAYSLFLTGFGGILASIASLLVLCFNKDCRQSQQSQQTPQGHMANRQTAYYPPAGNAYYSHAGNFTNAENAYPMAPKTTKNQYSYGQPAYPAQPPPYHIA